MSKPKNKPKKKVDKKQRFVAPKGNTYNRKYKTDKEVRGMFDRYLDHIRGGLSKSCFPECDNETVLFYLTKFPEICKKEEIEQAMREQRKLWEGIGLKGTIGKIPYFNAQSWKFNMMNRFKKEWGESQKIEVNTDPFLLAINKNVRPEDD